MGPADVWPGALGGHPQVVVTTTPRPLPLIETLLKDAHTHVTRGSTYENKQNLAPVFLDRILKAYEGTRLVHKKFMQSCC
ncbi:MAG: hypothetical protein H6925_04855 [Holosporaceae bacterium]|nr:MAG: hypothetical protein H6925_04855 [Holosporaceae bacterium]